MPCTALMVVILHLQRNPAPTPPTHTPAAPRQRTTFKSTQQLPPAEADWGESEENTAPPGQTTTSFSQNSNFKRASTGKGHTWMGKGRRAGWGRVKHSVGGREWGSANIVLVLALSRVCVTNRSSLVCPPPCTHPHHPPPCTQSLPVCLETESRGDSLDAW